ncbi:hypothetical protein Pelo_18729 [Pelomyxa schiedti]|nr:hypothetical protein Pelo_18729 [Pelomyxa schiedti]
MGKQALLFTLYMSQAAAQNHSDCLSEAFRVLERNDRHSSEENQFSWSWKQSTGNMRVTVKICRTAEGKR